ncbi:MAG TPA: phytanoyl-CoA dioxygenase family protein, partial [Geminicoccaceae bacterium]|nr:phytanoyl-CoA dioxygenase family protein [Geminicoccaceae bacterium]
MQLSAEQIETYRRDGFIVVENVLSPAEVEELRQVTDAFVAKARFVQTHDDVYDLEPSHSATEPRVRRIKTPHLQHDAYARIARHPAILAILQDLVHP